MKSAYLAPMAVLVALLPSPVSAREMPLKETSCVLCHGDTDFFDAQEVAVVADYATDVHAAVGLSCHDCHGGNPDPQLALDMDAAKDEKLTANPFHGAPKSKGEVPGFCGSCHSDPAYMKRFRPDVRVDQETEYWTSQHGIALAAGDTGVATCVDCHGAHGIRGPDATESLVHPTAVAATCATCHSDAEHMRGRVLPDGRPMPTDQYAQWRHSVHAAAMFEREDLSAPTCNDCHGNHGAAPPGLESVAFVCGQCHGREAELFRASPKHAGLEEHNLLLAEVGEEGCGACHDAVPAALDGVVFLSECTSCHRNHGIVRPTIGMYGALPQSPCAFCHGGPEADTGLAEGRGTDSRFDETLTGLLGEAESMELNGAGRFDYLVGRSLELPAHRQPGDGPIGAGAALRPEFARLFDKFRIGTTFYSFVDPESGKETRVDVIRCSTCHAVSGEPEDWATGAAAGVELLERMQEVTQLTAHAERLLLRARRGGVETRAALIEIDQAVDAQIGLQVLAHTFSVDEDGAFMERYREGRGHAEAASQIATAAVAELAFRRQGLSVVLSLIAVLLIALALKIRQMSRPT